MMSQPNYQPGLQSHLKAQLREELLLSSLMWLLAGFGSLKAIGQSLKSSLDVYFGFCLGLSYRATHNVAADFSQSKQER